MSQRSLVSPTKKRYFTQKRRSKAVAALRLTEIATVRPERIKHTAVYQRRKFPSAFLECGTTLTVQVDLSFPFEERHEHGNFQRAVVILRYSDTERLHKIEDVILKRNCEALDGKQTGMPKEPYSPYKRAVYTY